MCGNSNKVYLATSGRQISNISKQFWKTGYLDVTKTKKRTVASHITHLKWSLVLPSLPLHFYALYFQPYRNHVKEISGNFKDPTRVFLKIPKWQHRHARYYKQGKLVSYFPNKGAKTCLYGLKILKNIEIAHVFHPRAFIHRINNLHTSYLSAFKTTAKF